MRREPCLLPFDEPLLDLRLLDAAQVSAMARFGLRCANIPVELSRALQTTEDWQAELKDALNSLPHASQWDVVTGEGAAEPRKRTSARADNGTEPSFEARPVLVLSDATLPVRTPAGLHAAVLEMLHASERPLLVLRSDPDLPREHLLELIASLAVASRARLVLPCTPQVTPTVLRDILQELRAAGVDSHRILCTGIDYTLVRPALDEGAYLAVDCGARLGVCDAADLLERFQLLAHARVGLSSGGVGNVLGVPRVADELLRRGRAPEVVKALVRARFRAFLP